MRHLGFETELPNSATVGFLIHEIRYNELLHEFHNRIYTYNRNYMTSPRYYET